MRDVLVSSCAMLDFRTYGPAAALHAHDFVQVVMPSRGVLEIEVDGRGGRVDAHHLAVIPAGATHAFEARGRNSFIVLDERAHSASQSRARYDARGLAPSAGLVASGFAKTLPSSPRRLPPSSAE